MNTLNATQMIAVISGSFWHVLAFSFCLTIFAVREHNNTVGRSRPVWINCVSFIGFVEKNWNTRLQLLKCLETFYDVLWDFIEIPIKVLSLVYYNARTFIHVLAVLIYYITHSWLLTCSCSYCNIHKSVTPLQSKGLITDNLKMFYSTVHIDLLIRNPKFILCSDTFLGSSQKNIKKLGKLKKLKFDKFYFFSASEKSPSPLPPRKSPPGWSPGLFIDLYTKAFIGLGWIRNDPLYIPYYSCTI